MKRSTWGLALLFAVLLALAYFAIGRAPTEREVAAPTPAPTIRYGMVAVKTSTPRISPTSPPTASPTASPTPQPTATWVPLPSPSPTDASGALTAADVPRINVAEAKARADAGHAVLVDVRAMTSFEQKHASGALSLPLRDMETRYAELPADKQLIFYCA